MGRISRRHCKGNIPGGITGLSIEPTNDVDLSTMTKAELLAFAEENGIDGVDSSMLKAEIYETIVNNT